MTTRIVVLDGYTLNPGDLSWDAMAALGDLQVHDRSDSQALVLERAAGAAIALTNKTPLPGAVVSRLPDLRYIGVLATGVNVVDLPAARKHGIAVTNIPGYGTASVAQHTIALMLELASRVAVHDRAVREGQWSRCPDFCFTVAPLTELAGKTLAVIGLGDIGTQVARIAAAMGMRIIAPDRGKPAPAGLEVDFMDLEALFAEADVLTLHCPLTPATEKLVNAERLARMKTSAWVINTGRGALVDEAALAGALQAGTLAGAGLDVLSSEPPAPDNPLLVAPHCIVTPHCAWASREARQRLMDIAVDNIKAFLQGRPQNTVA